MRIVSEGDAVYHVPHVVSNETGETIGPDLNAQLVSAPLIDEDEIIMRVRSTAF